jgi:hypothetical protein
VSTEFSRGRAGRKSKEPSPDVSQRASQKKVLTDRAKVCRRCREFKPPEAFSKHSSNGDGLDSWCKNCRNAYMREWRAQHRERSRELSREGNRRYRADPEKRERERAHDRLRKRKRLR